MIKGIREIHLQVSSLEKSIEFYLSLGLLLSGVDNARRIAFFNITVPEKNHQMLGLWENRKTAIDIRHFAFEVDLTDIRNAKDWLNQRGILTRAVFGRDNSEPIVHYNTPAASVYFDDPDGNELELYAYIPEKSKKAYDHTPTLSEWEKDQMDKGLCQA